MTNLSRAIALGALSALAVVCGQANAAGAPPTRAALPTQPIKEPPAANNSSLKETVMGEIPTPDNKAKAVAVSMSVTGDNKGVAICVKTPPAAPGGADSFIVSVNGKPDKSYDWIIPTSLTFAADNLTPGYIVQDAKGMYAVIGGKEGPAHNEIVSSSLLSLPGTSGFAYFATAKANGRRFVVINGQPGKEYDQVGNLAPSADGKHWAYTVKNDDKMYVLIDGKPSKEYDGVGSFAWSPDNEHNSFIAVNGTGNDAKAVLVIDGNEVAVPDKKVPSRVVYSAKGERNAYTVQDDKEGQVYVDGKPLDKKYERLVPTSIVFSPDTKHVAFVAGRKAQPDKDPIEEGDIVQISVTGGGAGAADPFAATETTFAVKVDDNGNLIPPKLDDKDAMGAVGQTPDQFTKNLAAKFQGKGWNVKVKVAVDKYLFYYVIDGVDQAAYTRLVAGSLQFSPDSRRNAYIAAVVRKNQARLVAVVDGKQGKEYDDLRLSQFTADSSKFIYLAKGDKTCVVIEGVEGVRYDAVAALQTSPDKENPHIAYLANATRGDKAAWFVVLDGAEGANYDGIVESSLSFSPDGKHIAYEARRAKPAAKATDPVELSPFFVIDKTESPEHAGSLKGSRLIWESDSKSVRALVLKEDKANKESKEIYMWQIPVP